MKKGARLSKFQSKCDEGFVFGYSSNSKAYRVYNQSSGLVEEANDVEFDETNGSQDEQDNLDDVGNEGLRNAMRNISIGDVKPKDEDDSNINPSPLFQVIQDSSNLSTQAQATNGEESNLQPENGSSSTPPQKASNQPKIQHAIAKDHPMNQIVGDMNKGVQTRSRFASFCDHFSFVSCGEPTRIEEALKDVD